MLADFCNKPCRENVLEQSRGTSTKSCCTDVFSFYLEMDASPSWPIVSGAVDANMGIPLTSRFNLPVGQTRRQNSRILVTIAHDP